MWYIQHFLKTRFRLLNQKSYYTSLNRTRICESALPFAQALDDLQRDYIDPLLKEKTNFISANEMDQKWAELERKNLVHVRESIQKTESLSPLIDFVPIIEGLIVHSKHRPAILDLNHGRLVPENGPLIRAIYNYIDRDVFKKVVILLQGHKIIREDNLITKAYLCAEIRRFIRKTSRMPASQYNVNLSAIHSLKDAAFSLTDQNKEVLEAWGVYPLIVQYNRSKSAEDKMKIDDFFSQPNNFDGNNLAPEVLSWIDRYYLGLKFNDLEQKYINRNSSNGQVSYEKIYQLIIDNSNKTNSNVNKKMNQLTEVTEEYVSDMKKTGLSSVFEDKNTFNIKEPNVHPMPSSGACSGPR